MLRWLGILCVVIWASMAFAQTPTPTRPPGSTPRLAGFIPGVGSPRGMRYDPQSGVLYVTSNEFGLESWSFANPNVPVELGSAPIPFDGYQVGVASDPIGGLAAVTRAGKGLLVLDISHPASPVALKSLNPANTSYNRVVVAGNWAYALVFTTVPELQVISLSTSPPTIVGHCAVGGTSDIKLVGAFAYVATGTTSVQVVDVSVRTNPHIVGTVVMPDRASGIAVDGAIGIAYVAATTSFQVFDTTTLAIIGSVPTAATGTAFSGNRAYVIDQNTNQFKVINVATPASPVLMSTSSGLPAQNIEIVPGGNPVVAVLSTNGPNGMFALNVSVSPPTVIANLKDPSLASLDIDSNGSIAVVAAASAGLRVLNVNNPAQPTFVSAFVPPPNGSVNQVSLGPRYVYALSFTTGPEFDVIDLLNPAAPVLVGHTPVAGTNGLQVVGSVAYVATNQPNLQILNVGTPGSPVVTDTVVMPANSKDVSVGGGFAYVADLNSVQVVNTTTKAIVGSAPVGATALVVQGNRLYVLDQNATLLRILDVTTPANPVVLSTSTSYAAHGIGVTGTLALLAVPPSDLFSHDRGVFFVDASNGASPVLLSQVSGVAITNSVIGLGNTILAGDNTSQVDVMSFLASAPTPTPAPLCCVCINGPYSPADGK